MNLRYLLPEIFSMKQNIYKHRLTNIILFIGLSLGVNGQISSSFELRYFSKDKTANGPTDFKGKKELFDTDQRVHFLNAYADVAGKWFMDSAIARQVVEDKAVERFLSGMKKNPLPEKRQRVLLEEWKKTGISDDRHTRYMYRDHFTGESTKIADGTLWFMAPNTRIVIPVDSMDWRFQIQWSAKSDNRNVPFSLSILDGKRVIAESGFHSNGNIFFTDKGFDRMGLSYQPGKWYNFRLEADLGNGRYNLYVDNELIADWTELINCSNITSIELQGGRNIFLDNLHGLAFDSTGCDRAHPYRFISFIRENFNEPIDSRNWQALQYDDSFWESDRLPVVHGGEMEKGEDLFLRKKIQVGKVNKAVLHIETLDPGGEIWINNQVVFVTHDRRPIQLDISDHLVPFRENQLAIKVFSSFVEGPLYHSPHDRNFGWFCGRAWIDFSEKIHLDRTHVFTSEIADDHAIQHHFTGLVNDADTTFTGQLEISYYPWFPVEKSAIAAKLSVPLTVYARDSVQFHTRVKIENPSPWTHDSPTLYKVRMQVKTGQVVVDDAVFVTGIRTVSQEGGTLRINGRPELLAGAQTMGFRMPIENIAKWNRCAPSEVLAEELLSVKEMGNTLRIHVHGAGKYAYSVNDPRVAEMADQLGIMLLWPTSSWIREGEWGGIDFKGYPEHMMQVFNHPSIILWEGSNHPNKFQDKPLDYSNRFVTKIYRTIFETDSSRLIAPSSFNRHFAYRNDKGTIDKDGNNITPCPEWTAPMIVRGNQDAVTGYGAEWHNIRKWPDPYRQSFLDSRERAYINFEHEESIGMQNFKLARGKPWYQLPSYENLYDVGSIGREFTLDEWRASQAWQAFSAYESMKWQRIQDVDGFSWCCLHGGPNSGSYRKPIIDALGHAKLAFYTNKMVLQDILAGSSNTDVIYGKKDKVAPLVLNVGEQITVNLKVIVKNLSGDQIMMKKYDDIVLKPGRTVYELPAFKPKLKEEGYYVFEYYVLRN